MLIGSKCSFPVTVYFSELQINTPWQQVAWHLDGVLPAISQDQVKGRYQVYTGAEKKHQIIRWEGLQVMLEYRSCHAYYENLASSRPKIFVICHHDSNKEPIPFLVSFDLSEAEAYMEADEQIYSCPLAPDLYLLLEHYVVENYKPKTPEKRQRMP